MEDSHQELVETHAVLSSLGLHAAETDRPPPQQQHCRRMGIDDPSAFSHASLSARHSTSSTEGSRNTGGLKFCTSLASTAATASEEMQSRDVTQRNFRQLPQHPERTVILTIGHLDCAITEVALRRLLKQTSGITSFWIDSQRHTVYMTYNLGVINALTLNRILRTSGYCPLGCTLTTPWRRDLPFLEEDVAQLTLKIPTAYQMPSGWTMLQNHTLAQDGLKACVISNNGKTMFVSYDAVVTGARSLLAYINGSGIACCVETNVTGDKEHAMMHMSHRHVPGGLTLILILGAFLLWTDLCPPESFQTCLLNGVSTTALLQILLALFSCTFVGSTSLDVGVTRYWKTGQPNAHFMVALAGVMTLFVGSMVLIGSWITAPETQEDCSALVHSVPLDVVAWIFLLWCSGVEISCFLKRRLCRFWDSHYIYCHSLSMVRLVTPDGGAVQKALPRDLVERGDTLCIKPGQRVPFDGIALTTCVVQEPALVSSILDARPRRVVPKDAILAGSLVMRSELHVSVTTVGQSALQTALLCIQAAAQSSSASAPLMEWSPSWYTFCWIMGTVSGVYYMVALPREPQLITAILMLMYGICAASGVYLAGLTNVFLSATASLPQITSGYLAALGCALLSPTAVTKAAKVIVCDMACLGVAQDAGWTPLSRPFHDTCHVTCLGDSKSLDVPWSSVDMIWSIVFQLDTGSDSISAGHSLRDHVPEHVRNAGSADVANSTHRLYPGNGVEGYWVPPLQGTTTTFVDGEDSSVALSSSSCLAPGIPCAAGSLEFIHSCHCYGLHGEKTQTPLYKEWEQLKQNCETAWCQGYDTTVVSACGIPLGALVWKRSLDSHTRQMIEYMHTSLDVAVWITTKGGELHMKALAKNAGLPPERLLTSPSDDACLQVCSRVCQQEDSVVALVASTSHGLRTVAEDPGLQPRTLGIRVGADIKDDIGVDVAFRGLNLLGIINLLRVARMATQLKHIIVTVSVLGSCVGMALFVLVIPGFCVKFAPILGLLFSLGLEWLVLGLALTTSIVAPARVLRRAAARDPIDLKTSQNTITLDKSLPSVDASSCRTDELILPPSSVTVNDVVRVLRRKCRQLIQWGVARFRRPAKLLPHTADQEPEDFLLHFSDS